MRTLIFLFLVYTTVAQTDLLPPPDAVLTILGKTIAAPDSGTDVCVYIKPAHDPMPEYNRGSGLGLRSSSMFINETNRLPNGTYSFCPSGVVKETSLLQDGICVRLYPVVKTEDGIIRVSTDLNFEFSFPDVCNQATVWRLEKVWGTKYVNLGGEIGNPGPETVSNWFKIESIVGDDLRYKMVHCPGELVCPAPCKVKCKDLGLVMQNGKVRLALAKKPYHVLFERA